MPDARNAAALCVRRLGVDESVARAVAMAVTEACSNVVLHAYREQDEPGTLTIVIEEDDGICVTVSDDGLGMVPRLDSPGIGMGLPLISRLADHLELRSGRRGGSEVSMRFDVARARSAA